MKSNFILNYIFINLQLVDRFTQEFFDDVDDYVAHVDEAVGREVGRCGPMSTVYNATTSSVCKDILYPFVSEIVLKFLIWIDLYDKIVMMLIIN